MIKFSSSLKLNEIHLFDSPFNEDPKNINFPREALISGEGRPENLGKMGNKSYRLIRFFCTLIQKNQCEMKLMFFYGDRMLPG